MTREVIVCAANKYGDLIICGARHYDRIMRGQIRAIPNFREIRREHGEVQGFINNYGEFLTREAALKVVEENDQPFDEERNSGNGDKLYSEGLY